MLSLRTARESHTLSSYESLVQLNVGKVVALTAVLSRTGIHGSCIGGIKNTPEVIDLCAQNNIKPEMKIVGPKDVGMPLQLFSQELMAESTMSWTLQGSRRHHLDSPWI